MKWTPTDVAKLTDCEIAKLLNQSPTEQEPVPNPMIEGEVDLPIEVKQVDSGYWIASFENCIANDETKQAAINRLHHLVYYACKKQSSQPIVKGEGKWNDEDMCKFAEWIAKEGYEFATVSSYYNWHRSYPFDQSLTSQLLAKFKPTPSPEKQEEVKTILVDGQEWRLGQKVYHFGWPGIITELRNTENFGWLIFTDRGEDGDIPMNFTTEMPTELIKHQPTPKPDGMQGEKEDKWDVASLFGYSDQDVCNLLNAMDGIESENKELKETEKELRNILINVREERNSYRNKLEEYASQFKALPDITEGEIEKAFIDCKDAEPGEYKTWKAAIKWLQSHPKAQPQAGKDRENHIGEVNKLVEVCREIYESDKGSPTLWNYFRWFAPGLSERFKSALQSITQQDNKQEGI